MLLRRAFTLIELLVAISIIIVLASLILAAVPLLREQSRGQATLQAMQVIQRSIEVLRAQRGGLPSPVEHPFAGSKAERFAFVRADGSTAVPTSGSAILRAPTGWVGAGIVLLPDDLFSDSRCPMLYGVPRRDLRVLGAELADITAGERIADDGSSVSRIAAGTPADATTALEFLLTAGGGMEELIRLKAYRQTPDDTNLILSSRVWSDGAAAWRGVPGNAVRIGSAPQNYLLRGAGLYDAWGREILAVSASGGIRFTSAGRDGVFRLDIAKFGTPSVVPPPDGPVSGKDGSQDNISTTPAR